MADATTYSDNRQYLSPVWSHYTDIVVDHAQGPFVYGTDGNRYIDFTCGIGVTNTGHSHPKVVAAAQAQLGKIMHSQINLLFHQPMLDLVEELLPIVPAALHGFFFSNSGAEAVEASIKLARQATKRTNIITFTGSFHGRTVGTMSLTNSNPIYRIGYQPLMAGVFVAPFPYAYRYGWEPEATTEFCLRELRHLLATQTAPSETAAILIEPVLGEGGYVPPTPGFLEGVQQIAREHGILLIVDEVQSGFGRTGKWFGFQHYGTAAQPLEPDIIVMAKGIASGLPLSGIAARPELMAKWPTGSHGGTYGGNAVSCAAAVATIRAMRDEKMIENAATMGDGLQGRLRQLQEEYPQIGDVRGLGLMVGAEFVTDTGQPDGKLTKAITKEALHDKLMLLTCGPYGNVIRWIPPINVSAAVIDEATGIFAGALKKVIG
jgi:4-aminobutyrate aminotransferase